jgi:hypothetical protein
VEWIDEGATNHHTRRFFEPRDFNDKHNAKARGLLCSLGAYSLRDELILFKFIL